MPTIKGIRQAGEQGGSIELGSDKVLRRYALEWIVIADNTSQGSITIRNTTGLPRVGVSAYAYNGESDLSAICKRKHPRRDARNPLLWYVRVEYDNDANSQSQETEDDEQTADQRPATIEWDAEFADEVLYRDFSDPQKDVVNPVGHAFDPPLTKRVIYPVLVIQRYQLTFAPATILNFTDHVNASAFWGADPGHALMSRIRAKQVVEGNARYWQVTYRIRFAVHDDGYQAFPLNQGTHYLSRLPVSLETEEELLTPFIKNNVPYIGNLNLDGTAAGDGVRTYGGKDGLGFAQYPQAEFNSLSLGP
jgi:hypothetical protein